MTTIAILSDIHGNMTAFSAVIQDAKAHQADEYWFLGDLFYPVQVLISYGRRCTDSNPHISLKATGMTIYSGYWMDQLICHSQQMFTLVDWLPICGRTSRLKIWQQFEIGRCMKFSSKMV